MAAAAAAAPEATRSEEAEALSSPTLRVRAELVDRFVNQAGEIGVARSRINDELRTLRDARSLLGFALFAPFATFLLDEGPLSLVLAFAGAVCARWLGRRDWPLVPAQAIRGVWLASALAHSELKLVHDALRPVKWSLLRRSARSASPSRSSRRNRWAVRHSKASRLK